ncbi:PREDICTED: uncharacterized protein LOC107344333, partial [Paramuricea clavata]
MKLTTELENHYKEKLLSKADGSFDGHFWRRYMGKGKTKNDVQGYKQPNKKEKETFLQNVKKFANDVFQVASLTDSNRSYMVEMSMGVCTCDWGKDDSPCKHQYLNWVTKQANFLNFLPVACPELRQTIAVVALGEAVPMSKYTSLRDSDPSVPLSAYGPEVGEEFTMKETSTSFPEQ